MRVIALLIVFLSLATSAQAVCPAAPVSSGHDTVIQLKASGGVAGIGPAANLVSNTQGTLIFDTSANTVKFCDGTNWVDLGGGGGGGGSIPAGAVMAFDLASCPMGWTEYTAARGRFLRGIDNGAGNDPAGTRAPGNVQADALKSHSHQITQYKQIDGGGNGNNSWFAGNPSPLPGTSFIRNLETNEGAVETRPKNVAVLFCRKS